MRHRSGLNRHARRLVDKADRCLERGTKIPGGVEARLKTVNPTLLDRLAARRGCVIGEGGSILPAPVSDTPDSTEAEEMAAAA
jgi:hypothetical protein